jgi:hypothetical protein
MGNPWHAATSWSEVCRRAAGRRQYHALRQLKAERRRITMARRLNELRDEAWRKFSRGDTKRIPRWIPCGARTQLAREFAVSRDTIWRDLRAMEGWDMTAEKAHAKDPRFAWAYEPRPRMPRINVRVLAELLDRLKGAAQTQGVDISHVSRRALQAFLSGPPNEPSPTVRTLQADEANSQGVHILEECAMALLAACEPTTRQRLLTAATQLRLPLHEVITARLLVTSKP